MDKYAASINIDQPLRNLDLVIAFEEDTEELERIAKGGNIGGLLSFIERGRRNQPGDAEPPVSLLKK